MHFVVLVQALSLANSAQPSIDPCTLNLDIERERERERERD